MSYTVKAIEPDTTEHVFTIEEDEYILDKMEEEGIDAPYSVSYTHLTLPTKRIV